MNYQKCYNKIIACAKNRQWKKYKCNSANYVYFERHHVIPLSLNGKDIQENIVCLTAKEHFICHLLLLKITNNINMLFAAKYLANRFKDKKYNVKITSRIYEMLKQKFSIVQSNRMTGKNNPMYNNRSIFITNGIINKRIDCNQPIPIGFKKGITRKQRTDKGLFVFCHNPVTHENRKILKTENLPDGFVYGMYMSENGKQKASKRILALNQWRKDTHYHLSEEHKNKLRGKIIVNNGLIEKFVYPDSIPEQFKPGRLPFSEETCMKISKSKLKKYVH